jgi:hypothetical protein
MRRRITAFLAEPVCLFRIPGTVTQFEKQYCIMQRKIRHSSLYRKDGQFLFAFLVFGIILFGVSGTRAADPIATQWISFSPLVIPQNGSSNTKLSVKINGTPSSVRLALASGGTLNLTDDGTGIWSASLSPSQTLFNYLPDDANHNFVGFLEVFDGATRVIRSNIFVGVKDERVQAVNILNRGNNIRLSKHVVNIWRPDLPAIGTVNGFDLQLREITQEFYRNFGDDYDFINVVTVLPSFFENRDHFGTKNEVQGLGLAMFDNNSQYGSAGKLQGITVFPLESFFDMASVGTLHELGHQWINFSNQPQLSSGIPHWPMSTLARGIMGFSIPGGNIGGTFPFTIVQKPDTSYVFQSAATMDEYNDLELYMMGMLPADQVGTHLVVENQNQPFCDGCAVQGQIRTVTINDIIAASGARIPDFSASQKEFRVATIIVTRDRLLIDDEMTYFDYFSARGEATTPVAFSSGFVKGVAKPFRLATRGVGSLLTSLVVDLPGPALSSVLVFKKAKQVDHLPVGAKAKKFHLELNGLGFDAGARVLLNGTEAETTFINNTQLSSSLLGGRIQGPGSMTVQVRDANGSVSNILTVRIEAE